MVKLLLQKNQRHQRGLRDRRPNFKGPRPIRSSTAARTRRRAAAAENVSESEMMNSHIPSFLELIANGDAPPDQAMR